MMTLITDKCARGMKHDISFEWNSCDYLGQVAVTSCD